jgi:hypothetical protein
LLAALRDGLALTLPGHDTAGTVAPLAWRGGMCLILMIGQVRLDLLLACDIAARLAPRQTHTPTAPLTPVAACIATRRLRLSVHLDPFQLDLGNLCGLSPGDVLALPHALTDPVEIHDARGKCVAQAHLVREHTRKAVQFIEPAKGLDG